LCSSCSTNSCWILGSKKAINCLLFWSANIGWVFNLIFDKLDKNLLFSYQIWFGFCDKKFSLQFQWLGWDNSIYSNYNSIGIRCKDEILINGISATFEYSDEDFVEGDFVGLGIICQPNSKMECFSTCNGKLLGKII